MLQPHKPIACKFLGTRWDGVRHFLVKFDDDMVLEVWATLYENPYNINHLPVDNAIKKEMGNYR